MLQKLQLKSELYEVCIAKDVDPTALADFNTHTFHWARGDKATQAVEEKEGSKYPIVSWFPKSFYDQYLWFRFELDWESFITQPVNQSELDRYRYTHTPFFNVCIWDPAIQLAFYAGFELFLQHYPEERQNFRANIHRLLLIYDPNLITRVIDRIVQVQVDYNAPQKTIEFRYTPTSDGAPHVCIPGVNQSWFYESFISYFLISHDRVGLNDDVYKKIVVHYGPHTSDQLYLWHWARHLERTFNAEIAQKAPNLFQRGQSVKLEVDWLSALAASGSDPFDGFGIANKVVRIAEYFGSSMTFLHAYINVLQKEPSLYTICHTIKLVYLHQESDGQEYFVDNKFVINKDWCYGPYKEAYKYETILLAEVQRRK